LLKKTYIGGDTTFGGSAVVPMGSQTPDGMLIGVGTLFDQATMSTPGKS